MAKHQWFACDSHVFDSDFGVDVRERFGPVGLCLWVGFLAACKRNIVPGQIRFSSDAECLTLLGLPGLELVDEELDPFTLDDFWTFLGRMKKARTTRKKRLTNVSCTRWGEWQKDARTQREAERKARSRAESERTDDGHDADENRTDRDLDLDLDSDHDTPLPPATESVENHLRALP